MSKKQKRPLSDEEKLLVKFQKKLQLEAVMKSLIIGFVCGFALCIPVSIISFIAEFNTIWISLGVLVAGALGFAFLAYRKYYRTNMKKTASRVDGVGLEERMITMLEYADRDDALAKRQREDARRALSEVELKHVKIPFPKTAVIAVAVAAAIAVVMIVTSTVHAVRAEEAASSTPPIEQPVESEEDKIIREMIEEIRREIDDAKVDLSLKNMLHGMVDDLEDSLKPTDTLDVKIAKVSDTAQKIHKILQDAMSKNTIADELKKHDTTRELGIAIASGDMTKIEAAFKKMYDSIQPLVGQEKYDVLIQTAEDIFQSLEDAGYREPKKDKKSAVSASAADDKKEDKLAKALEDLANAMLAAIPPPEEGEGDEDKVSDEINQEIQDAIDSALGAIKDALDEQDEVDSTDETIMDTIKDALDKLGDSSSDSDDEKDPDEEEEKDESSETGPANPDENGDIVYDSVIDGKTPYMDVYEEYYKKVLELLTSGELTEEERIIIENYFNILN